MPQRHKRSISLPPDLDDAIEHAAAATGTTVSAWLAETAAHRLHLDAGRDGVARWEKDHGPLTPDELAEGLERARHLLGRSARRAPIPRSA
jgi:predicted transcriptional regulator